MGRRLLVPLGWIVDCRSNAAVVPPDLRLKTIGEWAQSTGADYTGSLSVGANNPDPRVSLAVNGNASFAGRMFSSGTGAPTNGISNVGDIVWNNTPQSGNYIGWVCTVAGEPGTWMPFGAIGHQ